MSLFLSALINLVYLSYIFISSPYYLFRILTNRNYRLGLKQRLGYIPTCPDNKKQCIWFVCASVGELLATHRLITEAEKQLLKYNIVISTLTPTAYRLAKENFLHHTVIFFPLDLSFIIRKVIKQLKPSLIILVEQELWPNFIITAFRQQVPIILINGQMSQKTVQMYRSLTTLVVRWFLNKLACFGVQTDEYAQRFCDLGALPERVETVGNMKYDMDIETVNIEPLKSCYQINDTARILIAGSTHHPEEEIVVHIYERLKASFPDLRLILAPRHPERIGSIETYLKSRNLAYIKRSQLPVSEDIKQRIILIDTIGELKKLYPMATIAFVGGSLVNIGGHNILEPVLVMKPVVFGPYLVDDVRKSADLLINAGAGWEIKGKDELYQRFKWALENPEKANQAGIQGKEMIKHHQGATQRYLRMIQRFIY
ncbi:3-deoxy-D-manno-octulosonic acid transferase [Planctomycetota bacterium]